MFAKSQTPIDFSKQLIKGKIAELVFEQMFRRVDGYTVIPFGYESIIPELVQYAEREDRNGLIENIRNAPDFALVSHAPKQVLLVEVKYRKNIDMEEVKETAKRICAQWKLAWIFYATPKGFYFDFCADIGHQHKLTYLDESIIPIEIQEEYLKLIREFI
ncbi:MAG: hypothetical protein ABIQ91_00185 [Candidatus Paceibacterota bacterium]